MSGTELVACNGHVWRVEIREGQLDVIECLTQPGATLDPNMRASAAAIAHGYLVMRRDMDTVAPERAARWRYILHEMAKEVQEATAAAQRRAATLLSQGPPAAC